MHRSKTITDALIRKFLISQMKRDPRQTPKPQPYLSEAIRALRRKRGLSQEALAPEAGITPSTLSLIECDASPTGGTAQEIPVEPGVPVSTPAKAAGNLGGN